MDGPAPDQLGLQITNERHDAQHRQRHFIVAFDEPPRAPDPVAAARGDGENAPFDAVVADGDHVDPDEHFQLLACIDQCQGDEDHQVDLQRAYPQVQAGLEDHRKRQGDAGPDHKRQQELRGRERQGVGAFLGHQHTNQGGQCDGDGHGPAGGGVAKVHVWAHQADQRPPHHADPGRLQCPQRDAHEQRKEHQVTHGLAPAVPQACRGQRLPARAFHAALR